MHKPSKKTIARGRAKNQANSTTKLWIWGTHAANAALCNPKRKVLQALVSKNALSRIAKNTLPHGIRACDPQRISEVLPAGAVHQGIAVQVTPLPVISLENITGHQTGPLLMLDGISDPRNIGAIFRSAAAFGASAIIAQDRHMPGLNGTLAKAAAGAIETVPFIPVVNLSRTLEKLDQAGIQSIGLTGETDCRIDQAADTRPVMLVLGAEGKGLRPNVARHCEILARIPMTRAMQSLNVASAASIALYELTRQQASPIKK